MKKRCKECFEVSNKLLKKKPSFKLGQKHVHQLSKKSDTILITIPALTSTSSEDIILNELFKMFSAIYTRLKVSFALSSEYFQQIVH